MDTNPRETEKQQQISKREDGVKEEIILAQEQNIYRLNELVQSLNEQLQQCQSNKNETMNYSVKSLKQNVIDLERHQILEE